jgi:hypothetical protein
MKRLGFPFVPGDFRVVESWAFVLALVLAFGFLAASGGCRRSDQIERYTVSKSLGGSKSLAGKADDDSPASSAAHASGFHHPRVTAETNERLLGAIVPHGSQCWFFKVIGPAEAVGRHAGDFTKFVRSIRFDKGEPGGPPTWSLPKGWQQEPASGMRLATIKLDPDDRSLEMSVIPLAMRGGDVTEYVLSNVNRWRGQVGEPEIDARQLASETTRVDLDGATATVVDATGAFASDGAHPAPIPAPMGANAGGSHGK